MTSPFPRSFYQRDTQLVARELLGKVLVRTVRGQPLTGRITEVEAYVGEDDLACHASRLPGRRAGGRTARTTIMYGEAGHAYVYLIYGMYHCLNMVTGAVGFPAAVLIRSLEPLDGIAAMQRARRTTTIQRLTTGPGKLTQALSITRAQNGEDMTTASKLYVAGDGFSVGASDIATGPRIGVDYAGACALYPWRYYLKDSTFVSRREAE